MAQIPCSNGRSPNCKKMIDGSDSKHKQCVECYKFDRKADAQANQRAEVPAETLHASGDTAEVTRVTDKKVRTLADLIRVCEIDTNEWEVERWVANKWEVGAKNAAKQVEVTPLFQVKAWLRRKVNIIGIKEEIAQLKALAKRERPTWVWPALPQEPIPGYMLELNLPDLHAGKLAWARETGYANYDGRLARKVFQEALSVLLQRVSSYSFEQIVFVVGNDLFHADNKNLQTTKGTQLDSDTRYHKTFGMVRSMMIEAIDLLALTAPEVVVVMVPGNHDTHSVWHLGDSLECYYHSDKRVRINNEPTMRKYHQFGQNMLMFTHGDKGKLADYPLLMATEQPDMWSATRFREAHTGDKHHTRVNEYHGVRIRILPALCPPDAWHSENHFVGQKRSAEAFVWHREDGIVGTAVYSV